MDSREPRNSTGIFPPQGHKILSYKEWRKSLMIKQKEPYITIF